MPTTPDTVRLRLRGAPPLDLTLDRRARLSTRLGAKDLGRVAIDRNARDVIFHLAAVVDLLVAGRRFSPLSAAPEVSEVEVRLGGNPSRYRFTSQATTPAPDELRLLVREVSGLVPY
jgi:hypothetical protein